MLQRISRAVVGSRAVQQIAVRAMSGHAPAHWKTQSEVSHLHRTHLDDHPVPEGSWQEYHDKRNSRWNLHLAASTLFLAVTIGAMYKAGCLYTHDFKKSEFKQVKID